MWQKEMGRTVWFSSRQEEQERTLHHSMSSAVTQLHLQAVALQQTKQNSYWLLGPVFHWLGVVKCRFCEYKNCQT